MIFAELLAELLMLFDDLKFWKKKRARRKFEKENGLQKKIMINPSTVIYLKLLVFIIIIFSVLNFFFYNNSKQETTQKKIAKIEFLLEEEKSFFGKYPDDILSIARNNPTLIGITIDDWENDFVYKVSNQNLNCTLASKGKDGILNTHDDIKIIK